MLGSSAAAGGLSPNGTLAHSRCQSVAGVFGTTRVAQRPTTAQGGAVSGATCGCHRLKGEQRDRGGGS